MDTRQAIRKWPLQNRSKASKFSLKKQKPNVCSWHILIGWTQATTFKDASKIGSFTHKGKKGWGWHFKKLNSIESRKKRDQICWKCLSYSIAPSFHNNNMINWAHFIKIGLLKWHFTNGLIDIRNCGKVKDYLQSWGWWRRGKICLIYGGSGFSVSGRARIRWNG